MIIPKKKGKKSVKRKVVSKKTAKKSVSEKKTVKNPSKVIIDKMDDIKAYDMFKKSRFSIAPYAFVKRESDIKIALRKTGFPCVMKVVSKQIIHKTESNGVIMNISSPEEALEAFTKIMKIKNAENVLIQKQINGKELIVGAKSDPSFGHIISVGIGGIYVEILKDVSFRVAPIDKAEAELMLQELKGFDILNGARGEQPINLKNVYETLVKLSNLVSNKKLKEVDINPLICNEKGCWITDIRVVK